jgi:hypothetical protein
MAKSTLRISIEACAVIALGIVAWRVLSQPEAPLVLKTDKSAPARDREDRVSLIIQQKKAEKSANPPRPDPASSFTIEATRPPTEPINLEKPEGSIEGVLQSEAGEALDFDALIISSEGGFTFTASAGKFQGRARVGEWSAYAQYREAGLIRRSPPFTVKIEAGRNTPMVIQLPVIVNPVAGPGFAWVHRGDFLEVQVVDGDTAAALAGLQAGDAIAEIGGVPVKQLDESAVTAALNGAPGSAYRIKVVANDGQGFRETVVDLIR